MTYVPARKLRPPLAAIAALGAGCFFSFNNPVEKAPNGSLGGVVKLQNAAPGQTAQGSQVSVLWTSGVNGPLTVPLDATGRFLFQGLPDGIYSISALVPAPAANDFPILGLRPGLQVPDVGGVADALDVGQILLDVAGMVSGTVRGAQGPVVVGAYAPTDGGLGLFEGFATTAAPSGAYSLLLPAGKHLLAASDPGQSQVLLQLVTAGLTQPLDFAFDGGPGAAVGNLLGQLVVSQGPGQERQQTVVFDSMVQYVAVDTGGNLVADGGLFDQSSPLSAANAGFAIPLPAGEQVKVLLVPSGVGATNPLVAPFTLPNLPVIAGQSTFLGQVTWLTVDSQGDAGVVPDSGLQPSAVWVDAGNVIWNGGMIQQMVVAPIADGGGRVLAWIADVGGSNVVYVAAETAGGFGSPMQLFTGNNAGTVVAGTLSAAPFDSNAGSGAVLTWVELDSLGNASLNFTHFFTGETAVYNTNGINASHLKPQSTTAFFGSFGGMPGAYIMAPSDDGGLFVDYTSDGVRFQPSQVSLTTNGGDLTVYTLHGISCVTANLPNGGACLAGSGTVANGFVVFAAEIDTSNASGPHLKSVQTVPAYPGSINYLGLLPTDAGVAISVMSAIGTTTVPSSTRFGTFDALQNLAEVSIPASGGNSGDVPQYNLLLDWHGQVLGLGQFTTPRSIGGQLLRNGPRTASLLGEVADFVPNLVSGYNDPNTGQPTIVTVASSDTGAPLPLLTVWVLP